VAARQSLYDHYKSIDVLAPQIYGVDAQGVLENELKHGDVLTFATEHNIKVMPLVTNKGFSASALAILDDTSAQDRLIDSLVSEARANSYIGFEMDFEQMDASLKDKYTAFISKVHNRFKSENLTLGVAVVSKISDKPEDYKNTLWQDLIGVYDYTALASASDYISVMSYDDPDSKGPIARRDWLLKVLDYSVAHISKDKISLGIGLYYWAWRPITGKLISIGGYEGMQNVMKKYNPSYSYSTTEHAPYLTYFKGQKKYTMWYENGKSVGEKVALIRQYGLRGASFWALGLEAPSVFDAV
jgi:spore germination protein YaaH